MDESKVAEAFKALADPTRVKILSLLKARGRSCCELITRGEPGLCACDIEEAVKLSQAAVSHHMGLLRRAGWSKRRSGAGGSTTGETRRRSPASRTWLPKAV